MCIVYSIFPSLTADTNLINARRIRIDTSDNLISEEIFHLRHSYHLVSQASSDKCTSIVITLDALYSVNEFSFEIAAYPLLRDVPVNANPVCYKLEGSQDAVSWVVLADHSNIKCYSKQQLNFPTHLIRSTIFLHIYIYSYMQCDRFQ